MLDFVQQLVSGIALGCVYGLIALGFVLVYKATEVVNFAQGDLMMLGGFFAFVVGGWIAGKVSGWHRAEPAMLHAAIAWLIAVPYFLAILLLFYVILAQ